MKWQQITLRAQDNGTLCGLREKSCNYAEFNAIGKGEVVGTLVGIKVTILVMCCLNVSFNHSFDENCFFIVLLLPMA